VTVTTVNTSPYGHLHQFGFVNAKTGRPVEARPPVWQTADDARLVEKMLAQVDKDFNGGKPKKGRRK
jgi:hypothetical protein